MSCDSTALSCTFSSSSRSPIASRLCRRLPISARNERGEDLLPALRAVDNRYTPVPPGPLRGICAPHDLILDLGRVPDPKNVKLFLTGWLYPQPNSSNINASQNPEIAMIPPTLSFGDGKGGWTREDRSIGLPCGKKKTIVLDLSGRFTPGDYRVKLTTTEAATGMTAAGSGAPMVSAATPSTIPPPSSPHWTTPRPRNTPALSSGSSR